MGWTRDKDGILHKPPFHQLEWAGYITSWTRAKILRAITQDREAIIATETDALFTTRELDLPIGEGLGAWKPEYFYNLTYVQSGMYYAEKDGTREGKDDHKQVAKVRGVDRGYIPEGYASFREAVEASLDRPLEERRVEAPLTRFKGAGVALAQDFSKWCTWTTDRKWLRMYPTGKRTHYECPECAAGPIHGFHRTAVPVPGGMSSRYPVAWVDGDGGMNAVDETSRERVAIAREGEYDYLGTMEN